MSVHHELLIALAIATVAGYPLLILLFGWAVERDMRRRRRELIDKILTASGGEGGEDGESQNSTGFVEKS